MLMAKPVETGYNRNHQNRVKKRMVHRLISDGTLEQIPFDLI